MPATDPAKQAPHVLSVIALPTACTVRCFSMHSVWGSHGSQLSSLGANVLTGHVWHESAVEVLVQGWNHQRNSFYTTYSCHHSCVLNMFFFQLYSFFWPKIHVFVCFPSKMYLSPHLKTNCFKKNMIIKSNQYNFQSFIQLSWRYKKDNFRGISRSEKKQ